MMWLLDNYLGKNDATFFNIHSHPVYYNTILFCRSTASILGQKKKNQRKARNKKRALDRRYSESEASDVDSKQESDDQTADVRKNQVQPPFEAKTTNRKDDVDIFHLEINN